MATQALEGGRSARAPLQSICRAAVWCATLAIATAIPHLMSDWLFRSLEETYQDHDWRWLGESTEPTGIVVLGGTLHHDVQWDVSCPARGRISAALFLARHFPSARILMSGGPAQAGNRSEAKELRDRMVGAGISQDRFVLEERSTNTAENAFFSRAVAPRRADESWVLVTSAYHMPRALALFREAGFTVSAFPTDWVGWQLNRSDKLRMAMREYLGLLVSVIPARFGSVPQFRL